MWWFMTKFAQNIFASVASSCFAAFFCNLLHFPSFPSAPPRAVFACPVEASPSRHLHLNCQCLDRLKHIIYKSMSRLHKLKSSLGNPVQKVTANTSQLRLSSRVLWILCWGWIMNWQSNFSSEQAIKRSFFQTVHLSHSLQLRAGPIWTSFSTYLILIAVQCL